jgi:starch phosphorylase
MKLALNGAITIGTLDGANVEISEQVGRENIFIFGHTVPEVEALRSRGYVAQELYQANPRLRRVLNWIRDGYFSPADPGRYRSIFDALVTWGDHYLLLADFDAYLQAQEAVDRAFAQPDQWSRMALHNIAGMGPFSSDRTIQSYVDQIWKTQAVLLNAS